MLQSIRDHTQGWLAGTIVSVLILMFAMWGISAYFTGGSASGIVAKVNGVSITKEHFALSYEQARRQLQSQLGSATPLSSKQEAGLKDRVLKELISTEALKQASLADHYHISPIQIDNYLESIPEFQDNGRFSLAKFQEVMATSLYSASDLLDLIKTTLLIAQPKLGIILTSLAFPDETTYTIAVVNQERDLGYLNLSTAALNGKNFPSVTPEQIQAYYQAHQDEFKTPEQVSIDYVELSLKDVIASIHPSTEALKNYYNENINNFTQPGQWKLQFILIPVPDKANKQQITDAETKAKDILQKIQAGGNFEQYAKQYNSDTSLQTELSGWVGVSQLPAPMQKPVLALSKTNPISDVIQADQGFVILKMTDMQETQVQAFDKVKDKVAETITRQQAEEKMAALRDQLADVTYEHPDSLQPAAKALNLTIKSTGLFTVEKGGQDVSANKKVRDVSFSSDVLSSQNNSEVIQLNPESIMVLRVKSHLPSALLPLNTVSKQIQDRLQAEQTKDRLAQLANDISQKLQAGTSESQIAQSYNLNWSQVGFIGRYSNKVASAILDKAFQLPRPQGSKNNYGVVQLPNGYAVIALHKVRDGVIKDAKQYALFAEQIQNSQGLLEYELYKQSVTNKAKVSIEKQS